jgi:hypothetical protein
MKWIIWLIVIAFSFGSGFLLGYELRSSQEADKWWREHRHELNQPLENKPARLRVREV